VRTEERGGRGREESRRGGRGKGGEGKEGPNNFSHRPQLRFPRNMPARRSHHICIAIFYYSNSTLFAFQIGF